jgi:hypothetical protein
MPKQFVRQRESVWLQKIEAGFWHVELSPDLHSIVHGIRFVVDDSAQ